MSKATHSPGPWSVCPAEPGDGKPRTVSGPVGPDSPHKYRVAEVYAWGSIAEWEANARLIAAAPDLLDVVQRLVAYNAHYSVATFAEWDEMIRDAKAAIAQAEGEKAKAEGRTAHKENP